MLGTISWAVRTAARFLHRGSIQRCTVQLWDLSMVFRLIKFSGARKMKVNKDTTIEDLINIVPKSISYMMARVSNVWHAATQSGEH